MGSTPPPHAAHTGEDIYQDAEKAFDGSGSCWNDPLDECPAQSRAGTDWEERAGV